MAALTSHLAEVRARDALRTAGLPYDGPLDRASSTNNEIHLSEQLVIRVSGQINHRLHREGLLYEYLPKVPWAPRLIASGSRAGCEYLIVQRHPGQPLAHVWPFLTVESRRSIIAELVSCLKVLHATPAPPPEAVPPLDDSLYLLNTADSADRRVGPLLHGLDQLASDPRADRGVLAAAREVVLANHHHLAADSHDHLIHGDLTFENILHHEHGISALVDFEWCRGGPPEADLDVLLRCCAMPEAHVAERFQSLTRAEDYANVPVWLAEDYPELFSRPGLAERLLLYAMAFDVRDVLGHPLPAHRAHADDAHPYNRLVGLVSTGGHVADLLARLGLAS